MNRFQWMVVALVLLLFGAGVVYAAPAANNCGINMLCRVRTLAVSANAAITGTLTVTGLITASSALNAGTVLLDGAGAGTATVSAGARCVCSGASSLLPTACSGAPTLTIAGNAVDTATYLCF